MPKAKARPAKKAAPRLSAASAAPRRRVPSVWKLSRESLGLLWRNRTLFLGISAIYALLSIVLVQSLTGSLNSASLRSLLSSGTDRLTNGILTIEWLFGGPGSVQDTATSVYEVLLLIVMSLAIIWALRQVAIGRTVRIRDSFYNGMYPLVPVILVVLVGILQLLPGLIGLGVYNVVVSFGLADQIVFRILWALPAIALCLLSLYFMSSAVIGAYIATLPEMTPLAALQASKELVRGRRWVVLRKLIFVPIALAVVSFMLFLPVVFAVPLIAPWLLFMVSIACVPVVHSYIYTLYRELLA